MTGWSHTRSRAERERVTLSNQRVVGNHSAVTSGDIVSGRAKLDLPEFDGITNIHASYQMVIRFNANHKYPDYNSTQLPQLEFYANNGLDP